ncbi:diguanylate cyclase DosC [Geobacter sp. OR-1]|uniref:GGDEF domain-containing response regulator n=1 Tax=Geobacter sp. OR-1 TaxID=1266765 RepID=UPI000542D5E2|nr:diguanylate cyclase [Geobacter sp. OR-1]GAM09376.1 diguanylate cyclase DosC [Geobacter sp. OR-1]
MERILVVEDDLFFREIYSDLLKVEGYEVDTASSADDAFDLLNLREYHVAIIDLVLHEASGLDILEKIKQLDPAIEVIIVTGHANMETAIYALKHGARDYLVKPINHDEFKHAVSLCIKQRRLLDENLELRELVNLYQVSQAIANCLELDRLYTLAVDSLAKEVGTSRCIGYFSEESLFAIRELRGFNEESGARIGEAMFARFKPADEKLGNQILVSDCFIAEPDIAGDIPDLRDLLILLIRINSVVQGVVLLFNDEGKRLDRSINQKNLSFLLDQSSLAFENAARYVSARNLINIDELTGLFNYRYLEVALEREVKRAERYGTSLSVIFLDIDQFKEINDTHGHLVGSKVLKEVGKLLKGSVREIDTVIRYGGDEYTILLGETSLETAAGVAERIRRSIERHRFLASDRMNIHITASLGYACYPEDTKSKLQLIELADQAMYRGKASGRNVVFSVAKTRQ